MVLLPGAQADMGGGKSETVYAVLGNDGSYTYATVVNCFPDGGSITDYGVYASVTNLSGAESPDIDGDTIQWNAEAGAPFYYEGETDKALPVSVEIRYYLDGSEVAAEDAAGKTGELTVEMAVKNETGTGEAYEDTDRELMTPMAVQVSLSLDNAMYSVKRLPENASAVTTGSTITVSYSSFPLPEDTFSFTMEGKDMTMEPISIIVLPKAPPGLDTYGDFIDMDGMREGADDMISGTDDMQEGIGELLDALYEIQDAAKELEDGLNGLADGTADLSDGLDTIYANARALKNAAAESYAGMTEFTTNFGMFDAGMAALQQSVAAMAMDLSGLNDAVAQVGTGVTGIDNGIDGLSTTNAQLGSNGCGPRADLSDGFRHAGAGRRAIHAAGRHRRVGGQFRGFKDAGRRRKRPHGCVLYRIFHDVQGQRGCAAGKAARSSTRSSLHAAGRRVPDIGRLRLAFRRDRQPFRTARTA